jgi:hypothetical protein
MALLNRTKLSIVSHDGRRLASVTADKNLRSEGAEMQLKDISLDESAPKKSHPSFERKATALVLQLGACGCKLQCDACEVSVYLIPCAARSALSLTHALLKCQIMLA